MNNEILYNDDLHRYTNKTGELYTSASQLVEKFSHPFDTVAVATRYAEKNGETPEYWIQKWEEKKNKSLKRGNHIHDSNEIALQARMIDKFRDKVIRVYNERMHEIPWWDRPDGVYTEAITWHHGMKIAGRSDKVILETVNNYTNAYIPVSCQQRFAHIQDYKTNEEIDFTSYQYKNGNFKMMLPPLAHLMDCNSVHYYLQLSAYMLMMEYQGFMPGTITLIHYPHPTEDNPDPKPVKYDVPYMKKEVLSMCKYNNVNV